MKLDERFHCFGCGADGDVIDFAARLFRLPVKEAAERLAADFGIAPGIPGPLPSCFLQHKLLKVFPGYDIIFLKLVELV